MSEFKLLINTNQNHKYLYLIQRYSKTNKYKKLISLGNIDKLEAINNNYLEILKKELNCIDLVNSTPLDIKRVLLPKLKDTQVKRNYVNDGITILYQIIKRLGIFHLFPKSKHRNLESILEYQISSRVLNNNSVIKRFKEKDLYQNKIDSEKTTFYNFLDILVDNEHDILNGLNNRITKETNRNIELVFYDSSTVYFESFVREGLRVPGYSKDGKFKEDQVVIGMATDENGIPIMLKVFRGNTADCNTFIPF
ncbi:IS1634 family transposase, partial [Mycoplasma phocimorsus]|nr:IS1634 family transposase [Mycoplasma phocimorsus]